MAVEDKKSGRRISVIIPTFNRKDILQKCLDGFTSQSIPEEEFEILLVNDGSTDGTEALLKEASKRIPNLKYFSQAHGGPAKARNLGIENASSDIVLFTGDDCIPGKNFLTEHLRTHKNNGAVAVLGHIDWHPDLEVTPFMKFINLDTQFSYPLIAQQAANVSFSYFYTSNISIPIKYLKMSGAFDEDFTDAVWEDVELGYRVCRSGVRIIYNPRAVTYHYHKVDIGDYTKRQVRSGKAAAILYRKHPELLKFVSLPRIISPEARYRYYQSVLDYYYLVGLQGAIGDEEKNPDLIPLDDRLDNWSNAEMDSMTKRILSLETRLRDINGHYRARCKEIENLHRTMSREISKRDKIMNQLHNRVVELEKLEARVKSSFLYQIYKLFKK